MGTLNMLCLMFTTGGNINPKSSLGHCAINSLVDYDDCILKSNKKGNKTS